MKNRITINFNVDDKIYSVHYMPSYYDGVYRGHNYEKITEAAGLVSGGCIVDRPMMTIMSMAGDGIKDNGPSGWGIGEDISGAMVVVEELDMLFPYWIIKTKGDII